MPHDEAGTFSIESEPLDGVVAIQVRGEGELAVLRERMVEGAAVHADAALGDGHQLSGLRIQLKAVIHYLGSEQVPRDHLEPLWHAYSQILALLEGRQLGGLFTPGNLKGASKDPDEALARIALWGAMKAAEAMGESIEGSRFLAAAKNLRGRRGKTVQIRLKNLWLETNKERGYPPDSVEAIAVEEIKQCLECAMSQPDPQRRLHLKRLRKHFLGQADIHRRRMT